MPFTSMAAALATAAEPTVEDPGGIWGTLAGWAEAFIGTFQEGGNFFTALFTGILPTLLMRGSPSVSERATMHPGERSGRDDGRIERTIDE